MIVGAGPGGMALAYLLARRGVHVTVLESHQDFTRAFRGEGLQRSGIDAIRQMGLGERLDEIPFAQADSLEIYQCGKLLVRTSPAGLGRPDVRIVSQPALLQMLADEAGKSASFRLETGVAVRDFLRENGRIVGVRAAAGSQSREYRADLVIGADGRHSATRKHSGLSEISTPQGFDLLWFKLPFPENYPSRSTGMSDLSADRAMVAFPAADGSLQVGFVIPKGGYSALRALGAQVWTESFIGRAPACLAVQLRKHRDLLENAMLLNVVCGRLTQWSVPGLLLISDAAHPMSPVGGQGINLALRDALVAANHLCPPLAAGATADAIDAAAACVQTERLPEIIAAQAMQAHQAKMLFLPDGLKARLMHCLLPLLLKTGMLQWLNRKEYKLIAEGVKKVKLSV